MAEIFVDALPVSFDGGVITPEIMRPYQGKVEEIVIGDSVEEISDYAFMDCSSLARVVIPDSVKKIGTNAFYRCRSLEKVEIPDSVKRIRFSTFYFCDSLKEVSLPRFLEGIDSYAFSHCLSLKNITIPGTVRSIGLNAFSNFREIEIQFESEESLNQCNYESFFGSMGRTLTVSVGGNTYPMFVYSKNNDKLLNEYDFGIMIVTGYTDYHKGKIYAGYQYENEIDPDFKTLAYCYFDADGIVYDDTLEGLKTRLEKVGIR